MPIPDSVPALNALVKAAARAFAMGYEQGDEKDEPSLHMRLAEIQAGPLWKAATVQDGRSQPYMGPLRGGGVRRSPRNLRKYLSSKVSAPQ